MVLLLGFDPNIIVSARTQLTSIDEPRSTLLMPRRGLEIPGEDEKVQRGRSSVLSPAS
jgi:hypothetical protein